MVIKICPKCDEIGGKNKCGFNKNRTRKDGFACYCKICQLRQKKIWKLANPEKCKKYAKKYRLANFKNHREYVKKHYQANREKYKKQSRKYRLANPKKYKEYSRKHRKDPMVRLSYAISCGIRDSLKKGIGKNGRHWEDLVGWTFQQLKNRFVQLFESGMTWENHGRWHIEHRVPISAFNFSSPEHADFKRCWALSNLQPMWAVENMSKHAKIDKPFQPSLAF